MQFKTIRDKVKNIQRFSKRLRSRISTATNSAIAAANKTYEGYKVQDNGKGVSDSVKETLFDPFVTTGRGNGSSGLGLHLVQQWVTRVLGGSIRISSRQDMEYPGLAFDIEIPLRVPED